jgi:hypothetical protein
MDEGVATQHNTIARINSVRQAANPSPFPFIIGGLSGAVNSFKPV